VGGFLSRPAESRTHSPCSHGTRRGGQKARHAGTTLAIPPLLQIKVRDSALCSNIQNVDRLHQRGGSQHVTELHGHNWAVRCLSCGHEEERTHFQTRLIDANHHWVSSLDLTPPLDNTELEEQTTGIRPDGDANVSSDYSNFQVPSCMACQKGIMKPTVVFFGENVPRATVDETMSHTLTSDGVLVIGSSLMVYSAFRFVHAADENHIPIALINLGPTRADSLASLHLKLDLKAGEILPLLAAKLLSTIS